MDIAEFVEATLQQIVDGVSRAQKSTHLAGKHGSDGDVINPAVMYSGDSAPKGKYYATTLETSFTSYSSISPSPPRRPMRCRVVVRSASSELALGRKARCRVGRQ